MKKRGDNKISERGNKKKLPGYRHYPQEEDIFRQNRVVEEDVDPEQPTRKKSGSEFFSELNQKDFEDDVSGSDLDIPGAELDDGMEEIGSEDEENNYYSLGGDGHGSLDEDQGENRR